MKTILLLIPMMMLSACGDLKEDPTELQYNLETGRYFADLAFRITGKAAASKVTNVLDMLCQLNGARVTYWNAQIEAELNAQLLRDCRDKKLTYDEWTQMRADYDAKIRDLKKQEYFKHISTVRDIKDQVALHVWNTSDHELPADQRPNPYPASMWCE